MCKDTSLESSDWRVFDLNRGKNIGQLALASIKSSDYQPLLDSLTPVGVGSLARQWKETWEQEQDESSLVREDPEDEEAKIDRRMKAAAAGIFFAPHHRIKLPKVSWTRVHCPHCRRVVYNHLLCNHILEECTEFAALNSDDRIKEINGLSGQVPIQNDKGR